MIARLFSVVIIAAAAALALSADPIPRSASPFFQPLPTVAAHPFSFWKTAGGPTPTPTPPGGISGCILWLRSDTLALPDGTAVSSWTDISGVGNNAVQATGGLQPLFKTNILASKPSIRFDGVDDGLVAPAAASGAHTFFIVAKQISLPFAYNPEVSYAASATMGSGAEDGAPHYVRSDSTGASFPHIGSGGSYDAIGDYNTTGAYVISMPFATGAWSLYKDGTVESGATASGYLSGITHTQIGAQSSATVGNRRWSNVDIFEVLLYNSKLGTTDRQTVETYLDDRWFPASAHGTYAATYASNGDANGAFYFIGQKFNATRSWSNPHLAGRMTVAVSPAMGSGTVDKLVDRKANDNYSTNVANAYFTFDLGSGRQLALTDWTYRSRSTSTTETPTAMSLEGSNDGSTWTAIDARTGISITSNSQWLHYTATSAAYRYFKLKQTALDNTGFNYFVIGEFELYGSLTY